ncbi:DotD/TraH family lipoprotein [Novacetimonas cocois]|uniref:Secretion protein n=1 Tax=Novacetimonas cocois TaxID=1747507 RepID=A0A365YU98_9PROT|nr:DotD/TraH family lipoprotein [Novacetimonas cocois]RBM06524.1 secretion protein [Novacetimonas cocois]
MKHSLLIFLLPMALNACAQSLSSPSPIATTGMANPELALQRSIAETTTDLRELGSIRPSPVVASANQPVLPDDLTRRIWFVWDGPLGKAVAKLGQEIGYSVTVTGHPRAMRVATNSVAAVVDILRTLGDQAGDQAMVSVDPLHHAITVAWHA